jgi:hypothetical protein
MKTIFKVLIGGAGVAVVVYAIKKTSTYQAIRDKFKFFVGTPRVHNYKDGFINIAIDGTKITNQSSLDLVIDKLYTSVQYLDPKTNLYTDLLIQNAAVDNIIIKPYAFNTVPSIMVSMPLTNLGILKNMIGGTVSSTVKVITRFQIAGVEVPAIENMVDFKAAISNAVNIIPGFNLLASNLDSGGLIDKIKSFFGGLQGSHVSDHITQNGVTTKNYLSLLN